MLGGVHDKAHCSPQPLLFNLRAGGSDEASVMGQDGAAVAVGPHEGIGILDELLGRRPLFEKLFQADVLTHEVVVLAEQLCVGQLDRVHFSLDVADERAEKSHAAAHVGDVPVIGIRI